MLRWMCFVGLIVIIAAGLAFTTPPQEEKKPTPVQSSYELARDYTARIFQRSCATSGCHRGEYPKAKLNLETEKFHETTVGVPSRQRENLKLADAADPEKSYLLMKVRGDEGIEHNRMPINAPPLGEDDVKTIRLWLHTMYILQSE